MKRRVRLFPKIAILAPRTPDFEHSQKNFNTGMVAVVLHGAEPRTHRTHQRNSRGLDRILVHDRRTPFGHDDAPAMKITANRALQGT